VNSTAAVPAWAEEAKVSERSVRYLVLARGIM
jgi:hypothetical protein